MRRVVPACAGMTERGGAGMRGGGAGMRGDGVGDRGGYDEHEEVGMTGGCGLRTSTPHLTSPLPGGRDELGEGRMLEWVPACAGMTERGAGTTGGVAQE